MSEPQDNTNRIFRPDWFRDLLSARLSLGETFWAGNYGTALFHQPVIVMLSVLAIPRIIPAGILAVLVIYQLALARAVYLAQPKVPTPRRYKVIGVLATLGIAWLFFSFARALLA